MSLLTVKDLSQSFIDKTLYEDANFVLNKEDHMGLLVKMELVNQR